MCKQTPIALAVAAVLGTVAFPAAAVRTIEINNTTNAVYLSSDTQGWDDYATTCVNATQTPGTVDLGAGCGAAKPGPDDALFFWGAQGATTNSTVELAWTPDTASAEVQAVRLLTPKDDDGNYVNAYGPDKQAIYDAPDFSVPSTLGWPDAQTYQRGGIWSTWGRDAVQDVGNRTSSILGSMGHEMDVDVTIGSGSQIEEAQLTPESPTELENFFWPGPANPARSFDTSLPVNSSAPAQRDSLTQGETVELSFYDAGSSANTDNPTAYMGDTLVQLKTGSTFQSTDPAEAGLMLQGTPADAVVNYERSGNELTATVSLRSGAGDVSGATYSVFNQGGSASSLGNDVADGYSVAMSSGDDTPNLLIGSNTPETVNLALAENTSQRILDFTTPNLNAGNATDVASGRQTTATQSISSSTNGDGSDGGAHTQGIVFDTVGPILGLDYGGVGQDYGTEIQLGGFEVGNSVEFSVANIFGNDRTGLPSLAQLGNLTNLTINGVDIDDTTDFAISGISDGTVLAAQDDSSTLTFEALKDVGAFDVKLSFDTDQGAAVGGTGPAITFNLIGSADDGFTVTPAAGDTGALTFAGNPDSVNPPSIAAVRAGTTVSVNADGDPIAITVSNTAGAGSVVSGNFAALTDSTGPGTFTASGDTDFDIVGPDGAPAQRTYEFEAGDLALSNTTGFTDETTQVINSEGRQEIRTLQATTVGPVLGVNDGAATLAYGSRIDLGTIDLATPGDETLTLLTIANLFGDDSFDELLTNLTIANAGITGGDGLFAILGTDYDSSQVAKAGFSLPDMQIRFGPSDSAMVGQVLATLSFFTDMNRAFGTATNEITFDLFGTVINSAQAAPLPGTLALLGAGLFGMAGLRRRRILRRGQSVASERASR